MRCKLLIISVLALLMAALPASARRFSFGVEGALALNFASYNNMAYRTDMGYRVFDNAVHRETYPIGEVLGMATANIGKMFRMSLLSGYCGLENGLRMVPVELRGVVVFPQMTSSGSGLYLQAGGGVAFPIQERFNAGALVRGGLGYSVNLNNLARINFGFTYRMVYFNPVIYDPDTDEIIPPGDIMQNTRFVSSLCLSVSIEI